MKKTAVVLAGGKGSRMKSTTPKQYLDLNGKPVIYYSLRQFQDGDMDSIVLVCGKDDIEKCRTEIVEKYHFDKVRSVVAGGAERYDSVYNALCEINRIYDKESKDSIMTFIHDGARPCVDLQVLERCGTDALKYMACTAAVPVKDTIKVADKDGFAVDTPDRSTLWQIQTPQVFRFDIIWKAYHAMLSDTNRKNITDDAMIVECYSDVKVKLTLGNYKNIKITTPEDIKVAGEFLV
jgi:2-C-methyl-D-erythritol 4-phosphate cytidylyltransferase